jgi:hypothetical protein
MISAQLGAADKGAAKEGAMVGWSKRLLISLVSWVAGAVLGAVAMVLQLTISDPPPAGRMLEPIQAVGYLVPVFLAFSFPGWIVAAPAVLLATRFCRWRFWAYLAAGTCIGPALYLAYELIGFAKSKSAIDFSRMPVQVVEVAFLTTLTYLLLVRRARASRRDARVDAVGTALT